MISLGGVTSALIARNTSWVWKEANSLARRLPSNVEKADLIQVGLIAVACASVKFKWDGDEASAEGKAAFVGYARQRVKGAMLDELRNLDHLGRGDRRKVKAIQAARARWQSDHGAAATLGELRKACSLSIEEIARLDQIGFVVHSENAAREREWEPYVQSTEPSTEGDEVEADVDKAIVLRRFEKYFATLPARERQVIDAYMGIGLSPMALAVSWHMTPSRVTQIYTAVVKRIAIHFGNSGTSVDGRRTAATTRTNGKPNVS
ncbi:MAG: sigma-70 family RNA polymerase sigma factor [Burkholderiaceae bacterium]